MKATPDFTLPTDHRNRLSRRAALKGTAAIGALALPAGAALAATAPRSEFYEHFKQVCKDRPELMRRFAGLPEPDAGLAQLEAGYRRFQEIHAERDRLGQIADDLLARAEAAIAPMALPEPPIPPELLPYTEVNPHLGRVVCWGRVPRQGEVGKIADAHGKAEVEWRHAHNRLLKGQPDYETAGEIDDEREELQQEADGVRKEVLAIPTSSPRGILIKLAIGLEAKSFDDMNARLADPDDYHGVHDGWASEDLFPVLAADLQAMAGRAQA